jgi:RNA polymerase sigma-70 factor (ECF subfamily)
LNTAEERLDKAEWVKVALTRFEGRLLRYASRFVSEDQAREIVQEAFLKLWQQNPKEIDSHIAEWLFRVCRNHAVDIQRKEKRLSRVDGHEELENVKSEAANADSKIESSEQASSLLRFIGDLPLPQQEVLRLKFQEDLSYKQISAITGHSVSHVGVLIHTAVQSLRSKLEVKP